MSIDRHPGVDIPGWVIAEPSGGAIEVAVRRPDSSPWVRALTGPSRAFLGLIGPTAPIAAVLWFVVIAAAPPGAVYMLAAALVIGAGALLAHSWVRMVRRRSLRVVTGDHARQLAAQAGVVDHATLWRAAAEPPTGEATTWQPPTEYAAYPETAREQGSDRP